MVVEPRGMPICCKGETEQSHAGGLDHMDVRWLDVAVSGWVG